MEETKNSKVYVTSDNSHVFNCYIKITSTNNCEIKMDTCLLKKKQILLQRYGWAIQQSQASANHEP